MQRGRNETGVLLIGDYPPPMGGIAVHVQQLHQAFTRAHLPCKVLDIGKGVHHGPGIVDGHGYGHFGRELLRHARDAWLLHLHTSGNNVRAWTVAMSVSVAGQMFATPTVITVHSGLVPQRFPRDPALRRRAQIALVGYSHIVAVSEPVKEALIDAGIRPSRLSMFPAFVASEVRPGTPPAVLAAVRQRRRPLLAAAHHPSPVYGRALLMEALALLAPRFQDIGLAYFGPGTGSPEYRADAERFGVAHLIDDFGEIDHAQALAVIQAADTFVRPTSADGDSVSVREALAMGVPCVATDVAYRPPGTLVARAGDPIDLALRIEEALMHRPPRTVQPDASVFLRGLYERLRTGPAEAPAPESEPAPHA
ncbi:MAG: glycosyltransferase family 4 protein [Myxococcaceae bacterium]|nr:glycosyltransferase family 4 protein [Myxococcaceae bacterium]